MENIRKEIIKNRINDLLSASNTKQKDLARELGVTDNTVSYFCAGSRTPNTEQLIKISTFFGVSLDYLVGLSDVSTPETDIRAVCEYTGLSETALKILCDDKENSLSPHHINDILNFIFECDFKCGTNVLQKIKEYITVSPDNLSRSLLINENGYISMSDDEITEKDFEALTVSSIGTSKIIEAVLFNDLSKEIKTIRDMFQAEKRAECGKN